jgi:hypothetical protein
MDATAFNRCEPATAGSARRVFTGKSRTMWTGKMADLLEKMQERSSSASAHFAAIQHDPQVATADGACSPVFYCP